MNDPPPVQSPLCELKFATYALVTQGVALYRVRFNRIVRNPQDGCAKNLWEEQLLSMARSAQAPNQGLI